MPSAETSHNFGSAASIGMIGRKRLVIWLASRPCFRGLPHFVFNQFVGTPFWLAYPLFGQAVLNRLVYTRDKENTTSAVFLCPGLCSNIRRLVKVSLCPSLPQLPALLANYSSLLEC